MKANWTLRQLLATLRGIALIVALFWVLIFVQLVPALLRGGFSESATASPASPWLACPRNTGTSP